jgi:hypothetical protein
MNKKRLLKLASLLHDHSNGRRVRIPGDGAPRFSMWTWIGSGDSCGTAACAVGCAMLSPWFQKQGLGTRLSREEILGRRVSVPKFGRRKEFPAVAAFFEISLGDAMQLFHPGSYPKDPTPKQVALKIRKFVAENA